MLFAALPNLLMLVLEHFFDAFAGSLFKASSIRRFIEILLYFS